MQRPGALVHWLGMTNELETPMSIQSNPSFHDQVIAILPKLRVQALALTRNRASAEDLVQDAVCNALSAQDSFIPGTNFPAWMHRILRNRFISNLRKRRDTTDIDDVPASVFATNAPHEDRLALKELARAMARLPSDQREALVMVVIHGMSYEALAESTGCAVGTAKSRVFRARRQLEAWLIGDVPAETSADAKRTAVRHRAFAALANQPADSAL
jgi:RNA polymerase sigma-70 factor (ECF subfamily)